MTARPNDREPRDAERDAGYDEQIVQLHHELFDLGDEERRRRLSDPSIPDDVRAEVEALLETRDTAMFAESALGAVGGSLVESMRPQAIGPYRILDVLGEGGMGVVYLAQQTEPVVREVAIKVIKLGMDSREILRRFEAERQALAVMSHDAIARVFDAGISTEGQSYFVMEYVRGKPLTAFADERRLSIPERIELLANVCDGVQHAHQKGVLHRDLKPNNVLAEDHDGRTRVKIIDFGLARSIERGNDDFTLVTRPGQLLGTVDYMSPEQARGDAARTDTRADVYSLGVMLFELLVGERPFRFPSTETSTLETALRAREDREPPRPSARARTATVVRKDQESTGSSTSLRRTLRGDLDAIVMKAMANEPERRYESCSAFAADLRCYLNDQPVVAQPPTARYRIAKFVRRRRGLVASLVTIAAVFVIGLVGTIIGFVQARRDAHAAELALTESLELSDSLIEVFAFTDGDPTSDVSAIDLVDRGVARVLGREFVNPDARRKLVGAFGKIYLQVGLADRAKPLLEAAFEQSSPDDPPEERLHLLRAVAHVVTQDEPERARRLLEEAMSLLSEDITNPKDAEAQLRYGLGVLAGNADDIDEAIAQLSRSAELCEQRGDDKGVAQALDSLAHFHPDPDEALAMLERAFAIRTERFGSEHATVVGMYIPLGDAYAALGRIDEAGNAYRLAIEGLQRIYGPDDHNLGVVFSRWSRLVGEHGTPADAADLIAAREVHLEHKIARCRERGTPEDIKPIANDFNNAGVAYWNLQRYRDAERCYERAHELRQQHFESGDPRFAFDWNNLGLVYWKTGRHDLAEQHLLRALEVWERAHGPEHPLVAWPLWGLAGLHRDRGDHDRALPLYERALAIRTAGLKPNSKEVSDTRHDFAELLRAMGDDARAEAIEAGANR